MSFSPYWILSLIVQVGLVVHVVKTGRNMSWIFILLFFPLVGTLAYLIVEVLPELGKSRTAYQARRGFSKALNPDRDLKDASQKLAVADTAQNALVLGAQYLDKSRFEEARTLYQRHLKGIHADDPQLLLGLAQAQFGLQQFSDAAQTLEQLRQLHPAQRSAPAQLLYARVLEALGRGDAALVEYESLRRYFPGPEATCRMALLLKSRGDHTQARELFNKVLDESRIAGKHYLSQNREWVTLARRESESPAR